MFWKIQKISFFLWVSASAFAYLPVITGAPASGESNSFEAQITKNTELALKSLDAAKAAHFLSEKDSSFVGFSSNDSIEFPIESVLLNGENVDSALGDAVSDDQDAIDAQIEGDWSNE